MMCSIDMETAVDPRRSMPAAPLLLAAVLVGSAAAPLAGVQVAAPVDGSVEGIIVRFVEPPADDALDALRIQFPEIVGWRALQHVPHPRNDPTGMHPLAFVRIATLARDLDRDVVTTAGNLATLSRVPVVHAEPDWAGSLADEGTRRESDDAFAPNDPLYSQQWGPQKIAASDAWQITRGDNSIVVAVIDTGLVFDHEEFQDDAVWINAGEVPDNGIDDDANGFVDDVRGWNFCDNNGCTEDSHGHGTRMAGIIGARLDNGRGIAGLSNVKLMIISAVGYSQWIAATYYAVDMGARAINLSGGGGGGSKELEMAMAYAFDNGVTFVASSGNSGRPIVSAPALYETVIGVGATDRNDARAPFSNYGSGLDVVAPGVAIISPSRLREYETSTGTSPAAAHVTGLVGLMYSINPDLAVADVQGLIRAHADDVGEPGVDEFTGYGRINARRVLVAVRHSLGCPGDVNTDGLVGFDDLIRVLDGWGTDAWDIDIDDDGLVGFDDLAIVLAAWGACE
jgi:subtilisin family serine protease